MLTEHELERIATHAKDAKWSKNAFNCSKCPKHGCPAYFDLKWVLYNTQLKTHAEKHIEGCGFALQPIIMTDVASSSYASIDDNRKTRESVVDICTKLDIHTGSVKAGMVGMMKLMGTKDIQRVMIENEELRNRVAELDKENVNAIEGEILVTGD